MVYEVARLLGEGTFGQTYEEKCSENNKVRSVPNYRCEGDDAY